MTTRRKILFYPTKGYSQLENWTPGNHACSQRSITALLAEYSDNSGGAAPTKGYRIYEYKKDSENTTFEHGQGTTHYRESSWKVVKVEEYIANIEEMQEYGEIIICYCDYSPLCERENPWIEMNRSIVSPDSFGGDIKAFQTFIDSLSPEEAMRYQIVNPVEVNI